MTDNAKKTSELPTANTIGNSDRILFLYNANTSAPSTRTITASNFANNIAISGLRNSNATMTLANTGIVALASANTIGYIGDLEAADGLNLYSTASQNSAWVSLSFSYTGNVASNSTVTGYFYLQRAPDSANTVDAIIQLPLADQSGNTNTWVFGGANGTVTFPDSTIQSTAFRVYGGPYNNDSHAASGGVPLNGLYYDNQGHLVIRLV